MTRCLTRTDENSVFFRLLDWRLLPSQTRATLENPEPVRTPQIRARLEIRRLLANLRAWLEFAPSRNPDAFVHFHTHRCPRGHTNRLEIRRFLANLRAWLGFAPAHGPCFSILSSSELIGILERGRIMLHS